MSLYWSVLGPSIVLLAGFLMGWSARGIKVGRVLRQQARLRASMTRAGEIDEQTFPWELWLDTYARLT